jgi:DNA-binding transcriptional ArsR family regulator
MTKRHKDTTQIDLVTHPVRLRILLALSGGERSAQQIAAALEDLPASSIYRHVQKLIDGGIIAVVGERRVRGAVERTLRLSGDAATLGPAEAAQMSPEAHLRALLTLCVHLQREFAQYIHTPASDFAHDNAGYRSRTLYATDAEWQAAIESIGATLQALQQLPPGSGRRPRRFTTITFPLPEEPSEEPPEATP